MHDCLKSLSGCVLRTTGGRRHGDRGNSRELESLADPGHAVILQRFFKTGPGEYGEGDRFRGIRVPVLRKVAGRYHHLSLAEAGRLLQSAFHEDRLLALLILIQLYYQGDGAVRDAIHRLYLEHRSFVNNWDLVDASAPHLVGHYLWDRAPDPLTRLAASRVVWERRMAIMATFHFIKQGDYDETLRIARLLLDDPEDLIHKAVGWMLREVGKRDGDGGGGLLAGPLPPHAPHHAALRHREVSRGQAAGLLGGRGGLTAIRFESVTPLVRASILQDGKGIRLRRYRPGRGLGYFRPLMVKPWGPMFSCTPCCTAYRLMMTPLWFCIFRPATPPARVMPAPTAA